MEGSNSSRTTCLSPQIDLNLVKVSKISSDSAKRNLTLSTWEGTEEDAEVLLALVLNFLPTLGAMSKGLKDKNKNQGQIASDRVRAQENMKEILKFVASWVHSVNKTDSLNKMTINPREIKPSDAIGLE